MTASLKVTHAEDGIASVLLARPKCNNAFDDGLIRELSRVLRELGDDPQVAVVVLSGEGKNFCAGAGADLDWMRRAASYGPDDNLADARDLALLMLTLDRLPKFTVARVQGAAYGGGVGLVACCDVAVAADGARFCLSEVKLGLVPAVISPYVVAAIGPRAARRYFQTAEVFDAAEAQRIGLVHEVVPAEHLDARVAEIVGHLRQGAPEAKAAAKALVRTVGEHPVDDSLIEHTAHLIAQLRARLEAREGIMAFLERRAPVWA